MAWQFWYPEFPRLLVVRDLPTRCGSFPRGLLLLARTLLSPTRNLPAWSKQRRGLAGDLEGLVRNDGEKAPTDLEAVRDVNSATCDFVDYWRAMELWRTVTSWTGRPGGRDSQKRRWLATLWTDGDGRRKLPRREKISREARQTKKRSRIKIVGSTILGNAKSKMPNTWRWTYFFFGKTFRNLANSNKWQILIAYLLEML